MQSVNRYLEELYSVNESKNGLIVVKVIFDDKNSLITSINGTLEDAKKYYIGKTFVKYEDEETGKEYKHKAIKVEQVDGLNESMDTEVHTFDKPMDMFRQIVKESQAIYVKEKDGKIEGRYNPKPKKDWILVDGLSANKAVKLYNAATDEQKAKIDKLSLTRFLNALWK